MKNLYFLFLLILVGQSADAQKIKDKLNYKVTYELTYKLDSTNLDAEKSEYMILFAGDEVSKFSSRAKTLANPIVIKGNTGHTSRQAVTQFQYEILKEKTSGELYYTLNIPGTDDLFYYLEKMDQLEWEILPETRKIKKYKVQKATTSFAGRDYIAWFTPEIPISDGPYKFNGLPGLILEIADTKDHWVFTFIGLEKLSPPVPFKTNLKKYIKTDKEKLSELFYRYRRDPFSYTNNPNVKMDAETHKALVEGFTEKLEKENNPIELE